MPARAQLGDELVGEDLRAAPCERHLRSEHRDAHGGVSASPPRGEAPARPRAPRRAARGRPRAGAALVERPLVVGERLDVPAHQLAQHRLDGRAEPPADAGPQTQGPVRRDGPQPLRLRPGRQPVALLRPASGARVGARAADLLTQGREERLDIDVLRRRKAVVRRLVRHRASVAGASDRSRSPGAARAPSKSRARPTVGSSDARRPLAAHARARDLGRLRDLRARALPRARPHRVAPVRGARADARPGGGRRPRDRRRDRLPGVHHDPRAAARDGGCLGAAGPPRRPAGGNGRRPLPADGSRAAGGAADDRDAAGRAAPRSARPLPARRASLPAACLRPAAPGGRTA